MPSFGTMKLFTTSVVGFFFAVLFGLVVSAQTRAQTPAASSDAAQLEALAKKIDAQNAKIDTLSQQILKLEQQIAHIRPGVMIGEAAPPPATSATSPEPVRPADGNTHTVARGETLTSIAKMYKVSVDELQKFNRIEDGRKLQAGQTIMIPASPAPTPSAPSSTDHQ
jgi:LysM repeat protein